MASVPRHSEAQERMGDDQQAQAVRQRRSRQRAPQGVAGDVRDVDRLAPVRRRAARPHRGADGDPIDDPIVTVGKARRRPVPQVNPVGVEQQDGGQHFPLRQLLKRPAQDREHVGERFALDNQRQNSLLAF